MAPPYLDQHPGLGEAVEDFAIEDFVAQRPVEAIVEAIVIAVLPRRARRDEKRLHADLPEPGPDRGGDEFAAVIGPDMGWRAPLDEQIRACRQHIPMVEPARDHQRQTFPAGLVDDGQDAELAPVSRHYRFPEGGSAVALEDTCSKP
jgi:hypothetical protein